MDDNNEIKHPLTTWQKIKTGVVGFVKSAISYIPKGLMFAGILFVGSALLESVTGWGLLHVVEAAKTGDLIGRIATTMMLGMTITGGVGAYQAIKQENELREKEMGTQGEQLKRSRAYVPERQPEIVAPMGLPARAMAAKSMKAPAATI